MSERKNQMDQSESSALKVLDKIGLQHPIWLATAIYLKCK